MYLYGEGTTPVVKPIVLNICFDKKRLCRSDMLS